MKTKLLSLAIFTACAFLQMGGCATTGMTPQRRAALTKLEANIINGTLATVKEYAQTGTVDTSNLIIKAIDNAAGVVEALHETDSTATPDAVRAAIQVSSDSRVVDTKVAPQVAQDVAEAMKEGVTSEEAARITASGLNQVSAKLKEKK